MWRGITRRGGLDAALACIGAGDVLVVWKLDRLGRSLSHLIEIIRQLGERGAGFASLSESIDTTMADGKLIFHVMGALAEFERSVIVERVTAGIAAAKRRGKHVGRPPKLTPNRSLMPATPSTAACKHQPGWPPPRRRSRRFGGVCVKDTAAARAHVPTKKRELREDTMAAYKALLNLPPEVGARTGKGKTGGRGESRQCLS